MREGLVCIQTFPRVTPKSGATVGVEEGKLVAVNEGVIVRVGEDVGDGVVVPVGTRVAVGTAVVGARMTTCGSDARPKLPDPICK
jgi:hypothetical protein